MKLYYPRGPHNRTDENAPPHQENCTNTNPEPDSEEEDLYDFYHSFSPPIGQTQNLATNSESVPEQPGSPVPIINEIIPNSHESHNPAHGSDSVSEGTSSLIGYEDDNSISTVDEIRNDETENNIPDINSSNSDRNDNDLLIDPEEEESNSSDTINHETEYETCSSPEMTSDSDSRETSQAAASNPVSSDSSVIQIDIRNLKSDELTKVVETYNLHGNQIIPGLTKGLNTVNKRRTLINERILEFHPNHAKSDDGYVLIAIEKLGPVYKNTGTVEQDNTHVAMSELKTADLKQICHSYEISYPTSLTKENAKQRITEAILLKYPHHNKTENNDLIFTITSKKKKTNKLKSIFSY